jgi:hypothetical protein
MWEQRLDALHGERPRRTGEEEVRMSTSSSRGRGACVIFMTGARAGWPEKGIVLPGSELALSHGAGVGSETSSRAETYAPFPKWQPGPPES